MLVWNQAGKFLNSMVEPEEELQRGMPGEEGLHFLNNIPHFPVTAP